MATSNWLQFQQKSINRNGSKPKSQSHGHNVSKYKSSQTLIANITKLPLKHANIARIQMDRRLRPPPPPSDPDSRTRKLFICKSIAILMDFLMGLRGVHSVVPSVQRSVHHCLPCSAIKSKWPINIMRCLSADNFKLDHWLHFQELVNRCFACR